MAQIAEEKILTAKVDEALLRNELLPLYKDSEIDCLILGCTHFSFLIPEIKKAIASTIVIVDPVLPVTKQVLKVNSSVTRANAKNFLLLSCKQETYFNLALEDYSIDEIIYL